MTKKLPKSEIPIIGKYNVTKVLGLSDSVNIDYPNNVKFVSFFPDKIILHENENDIVYKVLEVLLNETQTDLFFYIDTDKEESFRLLLSQDQLFRNSMPKLVQYTIDNSKQITRYSLHKKVLVEFVEKATDSAKIARENQSRNAIKESDKVEKEAQLIPYRKNDKWGFCKSDKKIAISCIYNKVFAFSEGLAIVEKQGKYGFINKEGKSVIPCSFDFAYDFKDGLARIEKNGKYGYINSDGIIVIPCLFDDLSNFSEGLASVRVGHKRAYINIDGEVAIPHIFKRAYNFSEGLAPTEIDEKWRFINKYGNFVFPDFFGYATSFSEGMASVRLTDKYVFIKQDGNTRFNNLGGKVGFIDNSGDIVIPCSFDSAEPFSEGLANVKMKGKWGFINAKGDINIPCSFNHALPFSEGLASVLNGWGNKYGFINKEGIVVIPCIYNFAYPFRDGLAEVVIKDEFGKRGYINMQGIQYWED